MGGQINISAWVTADYWASAGALAWGVRSTYRRNSVLAIYGGFDEVRSTWNVRTVKKQGDMKQCVSVCETPPFPRPLAQPQRNPPSALPENTTVDRTFSAEEKYRDKSLDFTQRRVKKGKSRPTQPSESNTMSYERILSIESLSEVPNPWKALTLNRCIVLAMVIVLVSSGVNDFNTALDSFVDETEVGVRSFFGSIQDGSTAQGSASVWDSVLSWWGTEEVGAIRRRKRPIGGAKGIMRPKSKA